MSEEVGKITLSTSKLQDSRIAHIRVSRIARSSFLYILSLSLGIMFIFPFFFTFMSSLKTPWEMYTIPPTLIPERLMFSNYAETMSMVPFLGWFYNTIMVVFLSTTGSVLTSSLVAYSFARFKYRFRDILFLITLSTMMLPAQVTLIPRFILFHHLGQWTGFQFLNTIRPLWIPSWFGGGAFGIFLMRQFIMTIPIDLDEAARIDGSSPPRIFWSIIMPLAKPAIATLTIISLIANWNSFVEPLIYINDPKKFTISVGVQYFQRTAGGLILGEPKEHLLMAASVLSMIVPIVVFFMFQEYFVQGVVMSGIKG